nr:serine hydrolase [Clostridia bacterium]
MSDKLRNAINNTASALESLDLGVHSFILRQNNRTTATYIRPPYKWEYTHMLNSLSKSFTSTGAMFAMQEGLLSPDDYVTSFFDVSGIDLCGNMKKMKVRHLLTMSTGHRPNADFIFSTDDCVTAFLSSNVPEEPGSDFLYNTGATYMISAIVYKVTGLPVYEYLKPRLFEKLGIDNIWWESCPKGIPFGGFGLHLHTEDIAKFGQFLLDNGRYNGEQLLDPELLKQATSYQIANHGAKDWSKGYGWQFWRCMPDGVYRGDGAYGQYVIVMPNQNAVMAVTSGSNNMQGILDVIWEHLLPALEQPYEGEPMNIESELPSLSGDSECGHVGVRYSCAENQFGITEFEFTASDKLCMYTGAEKKPYTVSLGNGCHVFNDHMFTEGKAFPFNAHLLSTTAASHSWTSPDSCTVRLIGTHSAYTQHWKFTFDGDDAVIDFKQNLSSQPIKITAKKYKR